MARLRSVAYGFGHADVVKAVADRRIVFVDENTACSAAITRCRV
ncbi:MAG: hypothetical protein ACI4R9_00895 [Kiritimatiellia bacterium]